MTTIESPETLSEVHTNLMLNREPIETIDPVIFATALEAVRAAEAAATCTRPSQSAYAESADYTVSDRSVSDGPRTLSFWFPSGDNYVHLAAHDDYGPNHDQIAGTRVESDSLGRILDAASLTDTVLAAETARVKALVTAGAFRALTPRSHILATR